MFIVGNGFLQTDPFADWAKMTNAVVRTTGSGLLVLAGISKFTHSFISNILLGWYWSKHSDKRKMARRDWWASQMFLLGAFAFLISSAILLGNTLAASSSFGISQLSRAWFFVGAFIFMASYLIRSFISKTHSELVGKQEEEYRITGRNDPSMLKMERATSLFDYWGLLLLFLGTGFLLIQSIMLFVVPVPLTIPFVQTQRWALIWGTTCQVLFCIGATLCNVCEER